MTIGQLLIENLPELQPAQPTARPKPASLNVDELAEFVGRDKAVQIINGDSRNFNES